MEVLTQILSKQQSISLGLDQWDFPGGHWDFKQFRVVEAFE